MRTRHTIREGNSDVGVESAEIAKIFIKTEKPIQTSWTRNSAQDKYFTRSGSFPVNKDSEAAATQAETRAREHTHPRPSPSGEKGAAREDETQPSPIPADSLKKENASTARAPATLSGRPAKRGRWPFACARLVVHPGGGSSPATPGCRSW